MTTDNVHQKKLHDLAAPLLETLDNLHNGYLYRQMVETILKMTNEPQDRGELKLINSTIKELRYAFLVYSEYSNRRKVTMFGSARTAPLDPDYQIAKETGKLLAENDYMVITGASFGIMAAGNEGAGRDASFGCNIRLPFEQQANPILVNNPRLINFKYFFTRKVTFVKESNAVILLPGGFGTLDEGFETLTLIQTGKSDPKPLILLEKENGTYWKNWKKFVENELLGSGKISPEDMSLFSFHNSPQNAVEEIKKFYTVYTASRFVKDDYVIYTNREIPENVLTEINDEFRDIVLEGNFRKSIEPLNGELDDDSIPESPRLIFRFDKVSYGRLRQLINFINDRS